MGVGHVWRKQGSSVKKPIGKDPIELRQKDCNKRRALR